MKARYLIYPMILVASAALLGCTVSPQALTNTAPQRERLGTVQVSLKREPARTVQARYADIDKLVVTVQTIDATATKSIDIANQTTATFLDLKPCTATVSVEAFNDASGSIGLATGSAVVRALEITDVPLDLTLLPNYWQSGNLDMTINLHDGPDVALTPTPKPAD